MSFDEIQGVKLNVYDIALVLPVILFLEIIGKGSRPLYGKDQEKQY